jgi:nucleotide-binding universal stress UspA family protein
MKSILVATDGSDHAYKALHLAADLAAKYRARLTILHTYLASADSATLRRLADKKALGKELAYTLENYEIDTFKAGSGVGDSMVYPIIAPRELVEAIGKQVAARAERVAKKAGLTKVNTVLTGGDPADVILEQAKKVKADTIVLGSRGLGNIKGLFLGSVSHKVSSRATGTCITVK